MRSGDLNRAHRRGRDEHSPFRRCSKTYSCKPLLRAYMRAWDAEQAKWKRLAEAALAAPIPRELFRDPFGACQPARVFVRVAFTNVNKVPARAALAFTAAGMCCSIDEIVPPYASSVTGATVPHYFADALLARCQIDVPCDVDPGLWIRWIIIKDRAVIISPIRAVSLQAFRPKG